jgi:glucose-1-phosphate thymidylyltransferase
MNIIIPMAGMGKRMRPHTLTTPKPLLPIAGKPIVQRLVEDISALCDDKINKVAFIIGESFGPKVEKHLKEIAAAQGAEAVIVYQQEALGTAHAVYCAKSCLEGPVIVAFADTLFRADFKIDLNKDGVIWVKQVEDPSAFGVIKLDAEGHISEFIEKPEVFVSDLAIIGIYFFKNGEVLRKEIEHLLENDITEKGEYQLTSALENMKAKGMKFSPGQVDEWMDCGNKNATVQTNKSVLSNLNGALSRGRNVSSENSSIIEPCFIGEGVILKNSTVGPYVSIGDNSVVENSVISNSIVQQHTHILHANLTNSMIGNHAVYDGRSNQVSMGDYSSQFSD